MPDGHRVFIACSDLIASKLCSHSTPHKIKQILWGKLARDASDAVLTLLQRHTRAHQARVRRGHQPDRNALEVIAHAALVGEAAGKTTFEEEVGKPRDHATDDVDTAARAQRQHIVAGHASQPAAELLEHFQGNRVASQASGGDGFGVSSTGTWPSTAQMARYTRGKPLPLRAVSALTWPISL